MPRCMAEAPVSSSPNMMESVGSKISSSRRRIFCREERWWRRSRGERMACRRVRSFARDDARCHRSCRRRQVFCGYRQQNLGQTEDKDVHMTDNGSAAATASDGTHLFVLDKGHGEPV